MKTFAERLKSARVMAGLSLQDLAGKLQNRVPRQALHKYEKGQFMPDSEMLGRLCDALGMRPDYFFRKAEVKMGTISFRKRQKFPVKDRKGLEERTKDVLERYIELEQILNIPTDFSLHFKDRPVKSNQDVEHIA
jgi:transcriptional regulator with XRE-family HTH domain